MSNKRKYIVIGMGQFGQKLCLELRKRHIDVAAVADKKDEFLDDSFDDILLTKDFDYNNQGAIKQIISLADEAEDVVVTIGDSFEKSLLVVSSLQNLKVPRIYVRVINPVHERILNQMDVYSLINLNTLSAYLFASQLESPEFLRVSPIDDFHSLVEYPAPKAWNGRTLQNTPLREQHHLNLISLRRSHNSENQKAENSHDLLAVPCSPVIGTPTPDLVFKEGDILLLFGTNRDLSDFAEKMKGV